MEHFVDDDTYAAALAEFGEHALVDLVIALGAFTTLALVLNTFQMELPPDREPPFGLSPWIPAWSTTVLSPRDPGRTFRVWPLVACGCRPVLDVPR